MKILLDHNIDRRFSRLLPDFDVATTQQMGWADLLNGELLLRAEQDGFEAFITADSNLRHQQNLVRCRIAIIVLRSPSNRLSKHAEMIGDILDNLKDIDQGEVIEIFHPNHHDR